MKKRKWNLEVGKLVKLNPKQFSLWVETYKPGVVVGKVANGKQITVAWCDGRVTDEWYWNLMEVV